MTTFRDFHCYKTLPIINRNCCYRLSNKKMNRSDCKEKNYDMTVIIARKDECSDKRRCNYIVTMMKGVNTHQMILS